MVDDQELSHCGMYGTPLPGPVSYTHLDVYKRQVTLNSKYNHLVISSAYQHTSV